ncbi:MAG TPA: hypothetical protein VFS35_07340 [Terrimicrobiaceae bacterium]|nr:hypothetical protein [Terrimicrobiaceae bacterium]
MKLKATLLGIACAIITPVVFAQTETTTTTTTTTTGSGTITEYSPGSAFIVRETSGPVTYRYGENVTYVTRSGAPLTEEQVRTHVKVGVPVRVQYSTEGENRILNRVEIDDIEIDDD